MRRGTAGRNQQFNYKSHTALVVRNTHPAYCGALPADLSCIRKIQLLPPARSDPLQQARPRYLSLGPLTCGSDPLLPSRRKSNPWYVALKKRCPPLRCAGATCPSQICRCRKINWLFCPSGALAPERTRVRLALIHAWTSTHASQPLTLCCLYVLAR